MNVTVDDAAEILQNIKRLECELQAFNLISDTTDWFSEKSDVEQTVEATGTQVSIPHNVSVNDDQFTIEATLSVHKAIVEKLGFGDISGGVILPLAQGFDLDLEGNGSFMFITDEVIKPDSVLEMVKSEIEMLLDDDSSMVELTQRANQLLIQHSSVDTKTVEPLSIKPADPIHCMKPMS